MMPDPSAVTTWPAFAAFALLLLALQIPNLISTVRTRRDARAIRQQTENEHQDAEHPNLREQLDAMHADIREAKTVAAEAKVAAERGAQGLAEHMSHAEVVDERRDAWQASIEEQVERLRRPLLSWRH